MASIGLLMIALGSALVYVALHGGLGLSLTPSQASTITVKTAGGSGVSGLGSGGSAGGGGGGGTGSSF